MYKNDIFFIGLSSSLIFNNMQKDLNQRSFYMREQCEDSDVRRYVFELMSKFFEFYLTVIMIFYQKIIDDRSLSFMVG